MKYDYVIQSDGGSRGNPGPAAYGFVIYDAVGTTVAEGNHFLGIGTNNQAEYQGILAALCRAVELGLGGNVVCKLDSQLVVRQLNGEYKIKEPTMQALAASVRDVVRGWSNADVEFTDVRRVENKRADQLVNDALDAALAKG